MVAIMYSPSDYIMRIEEMYDKCRNDRLGRFSLEWGHFSREMNLQLKTDSLNARDERLRSRFNFVFVFWIEMSKCLNQRFPNLDIARKMKEQALSEDPVNYDLHEAEKFSMIFGRS